MSEGLLELHLFQYVLITGAITISGQHQTSFQEVLIRVGQESCMVCFSVLNSIIFQDVLITVVISFQVYL